MVGSPVWGCPSERIMARRNREWTKATKEKREKEGRGEGVERGRIDEILRSHLIEGDFLRHDDFEGFFEVRTRQLLTMVEMAMGKC